MRVLIVESSDSIRRMIEALVAARGYEVRSAGSGARGMEEALAFGPDVVLLDMELAGPFDGLDVCRKLGEEARTRGVPIVILSAKNDEEVKQRALDAGAAAFYEKPFSPLALLKEVEALGRRSETLRRPT